MTRSRTSVSTWRQRHARSLFLTDLLVVVVTVFTSQFLWFQSIKSKLDASTPRLEVSYTAVSVCLAILWMLALTIYATRNYKIIGSESDEYKRIVNATLWLYGLWAIGAYLLKAELARGYFLISLPLGLSLLLLLRWTWRKWLHRKRRGGRYSARVLIIGSRDSVVHFIWTMQRESEAGLHVVAALVSDGIPGERLHNVEVLGGLDDIVSMLDQLQVDTIVVTSSDQLPPREVRHLSWDLEDRGVTLVVAPALMDVAGPRIHARPAAGLPLIHVEFPEFEGIKHTLKRAFDVVVSCILLVAFSPLLLAIAIIINVDSTGPVFFHQERIGLHGRRFLMHKFRTMGVDAEDQLPSLLDRSEGNGVLFKMSEDPRITKVGRFLRKYSLDELPQLVNVLGGQMSLVGPRPPLASELSNYDARAYRRLLVKPGITGLWQTSGRSDLSWEDSIRLDLYYVENWSLMGDIVLLYRTVRAVLLADGAY